MDRGSLLRRRPGAFSLVELLIVIGIIAVLLAILLPALSKAREAANLIRCGSNLRTIGQGIAIYVVESKGLLPPSNEWRVDPNTGQLPDAPIYGEIQWSSFLYARRDLGNTTSIYMSPAGWEALQCPSLPEGGLPPANTYTGNSSLANEAGPAVIDAQAPRLAYTVNEALCPRGFFVAGGAGNTVVRPYRFVRAGSVRHSSSTILATEIWGIQTVVEADSLVNPGTGIYVSAARRPVSGFTASVSPEMLYTLPNPPAPLNARFPLSLATAAMLSPDPSTTAGPGSTVETTLDWVGRNHGKRRLDSSGFDLRVTNFLYLDGHVETKNIRDTLLPASQWGDQFYSLTGGDNVR